MSQELLNDANREFEQIVPSLASSVVTRFNTGFQARTITPGLKFIGPTAYSSGGPLQNGPSFISDLVTGGAPGGGVAPIYLNFSNPFNPTVPNPGTEPPIGPEESLRYSCLNDLCLQDPNGIHYGIDECLQSGCSAGGSSGGGGGGSSGDDGSGGGGSGGGGDGNDTVSTVLHCIDRAFHCTFAAMITGLMTGFSGGGASTTSTCTLNGTSGVANPNRTYWKYKWTEVERLDTAGTWCTPLASNLPIRTGGDGTDGAEAYNIYEQNVDNDGGATIPAGSTVTRKRIPNYLVVTMHMDQFGRAWFSEPNPFSVACDPNLELILDGGIFEGAS